VAEAARDAGADHVEHLERTPRGTPRLDSAFREVDRVAAHPLRCLVHTDVLLQPDLLASARVVAEAAPGFLMVGRTREDDGTMRGAAALDWFVFPAGLYTEIPPFAIGRACFDNWLVWKARQEAIVVDATRAVKAVHQRHPYDHLAGGKDEAYY